MIYYVWFLFILEAIGTTFPNETASTQTARIVNFLIYLPLFGRLFGWF